MDSCQPQLGSDSRAILTELKSRLAIPNCLPERRDWELLGEQHGTAVNSLDEASPTARLKLLIYLLT